jgi:ribose transport system substrate-binding protein
MNKKVSVFSVGLLLLLSMGVFAAGKTDQAGASAGAAKKLVIAVVPKSLNNPVFLESRSGAEDAAKELGNVEILYTGSPDADSSAQVSIMEGLIEKKVDGILIACNLAEALQPVIDKAVAVGIVVATYDSDSPSSKRSFYIGSNNYDFGKVSADYMNKILPSGGKVAVLTGIVGIANLEERIKGFKEHINKNIVLLPIQTGEDDIQKSVEVVNQFTAAHPEMNAWWFDGGWPFIANPSALTELDKFVKRGGKVVSVDSLYPMLQYIELGIAEVLIGQNMYACGLGGVKEIVGIINGGKASAPMIWTDMEIVTKDNVAKIKAGKKPW